MRSAAPAAGRFFMLGAEDSDHTTSAPGFRERANGALNGVGGNGYSWASTVSGTGGMNLSFGVTWIGPSYSSSRAYGFPLRCLSE